MHSGRATFNARNCQMIIRSLSLTTCDIMSRILQSKKYNPWQKAVTSILKRIIVILQMVHRSFFFSSSFINYISRLNSFRRNRMAKSFCQLWVITLFSHWSLVILCSFCNSFRYLPHAARRPSRLSPKSYFTAAPVLVDPQSWCILV